MKFRKHLRAENLIRCVRQFFQKTCDLHSKKAKISTFDCLMACFGVFSLKWRSLLVYEENLKAETTLHSFKSLYVLKNSWHYCTSRESRKEIYDWKVALR